MSKKENNPDGIAICLNCYKIRFNEINKSVPKGVDKVFGTDDFISIIQEFIKIIDSKQVFNNKKKDRILYLRNSLKASKSESLYAGVIMKGHNGPQTSIDELVKNEAKTVNTIYKDQFHCLPYFFLIYFNSKKPSEMLFMAQSYRQFGFKAVFEEAFKSYTKNISKNTTVSINPLSVASLFEKYVREGKINKIRFLKYGLNKNAENILNGDPNNPKNYEMELSIKSKTGFLGIKKHLDYNNSSFIEQVQMEGFEYNEAYADIIVAGRNRTMNVSKPSTFSAAYDITKDVYIDPKTNHPDFQNILDQAIDILRNDLSQYI